MRNGDAVREYVWNLMQETEDNEHNLNDYCLLLTTLFDIPFEYVLEMDENRARDGEILRKTICEDDKIPYEGVIDTRNVSVLEVLIALAKRIENDILADPMSGEDHSRRYFWEMMRNLDIEKYSNDNFKELNIRDKVGKWLRREFKKDGVGSIFPLRRPKNDQRGMEIWNQMQEYVMENY